MGLFVFFTLLYLFNSPPLVSLSPLSLTQILQGFKIGPKPRSEESGGFVLIAEREEKEGDAPAELWQRAAGT